MAQVSPDGQWAVTTLNEELYTANYRDYHFIQTFYPTRGILGWYNRETAKMGAVYAEPRRLFNFLQGY